MIDVFLEIREGHQEEGVECLELRGVEGLEELKREQKAELGLVGDGRGGGRGHTSSTAWLKSSFLGSTFLKSSTVLKFLKSPFITISLLLLDGLLP